MNRLEINIPEIEKNYRIDEDGKIYSIKAHKYLKPIRNTAGHLHVCLYRHKPNTMYLIGRLVAAKYIGVCPLKLQLSYKDFNIHNNHYSNLEYISHSRLIMRSHGSNKRIFCQ